ncbi:MAG: alcohol dehydrogenase catalytic domain-containing protein [Acidimicrobiaceae bacterium]|nr:alcohol dehydrogenase catalytic domain-containing protein [Acidimicrobiaceae bacterium]
MKCVQVTAPGQLTHADATEPAPPDPGHAVVRIDTVGICGTDVKILSGAIPVSYPRIMGHEMVGVVEAAAETGPPRGSRVLIDPAIVCGTCDLCRKGRGNLCRNGGLLGRDADGVFAEYAAVPAHRLLEVPDSVSATAAGLLQVLGTCVHAQRSTPVFVGDVAVVLGLGVSGLLFTQMLRGAGATVIGVTRSEWKQELARQLGAVAVAAPREAGSLVRELTGGRGADLVVEAVGTEATLAQAIELASVGGEVTVFGTLTGGGSGLPYYQLYFKELTLRNPRAATVDDYARGIELAASGALDLEAIVTDRFGLPEAVAAFERVRSADSLKVLMSVA